MQFFKNQLSLQIFGTAFLLLAVKKLLLQIKRKKIQQQWLKKAQSKKVERDNKMREFYEKEIKNQSQLDSESTKVLLYGNISDIKKLIHSNKVSVEQVLKFYINRSVQFQNQDYNWLADINYEEALQLAREQDKRLKENRDIIFAKGNELFGIPVALKDTFIQKGLDSTLGLGKNCFKPYDYDGIWAILLKKSGAIIFQKTNIPQLAMMAESVNDVWGQAKNPWNKNKITGGSTGGEGGVISTRSSVLGIGSDIGGSIRIPSICCGCYGFKPGTYRVPDAGDMTSIKAWEGQKLIKVSRGPLARNTNDLIVIMKLMLDPNFHDEVDPRARDFYFAALEFDEDKFKQEVRFGYIKSFGEFPPAVSMIKTHDLVIQKLKENNHQIKEFKIDEQIYKDITEILVAIFTSDGGAKGRESYMEGEKELDQYKDTEHFGPIKYKFMQNLIKLLGETRNESALKGLQERTAAEYFQLNTRLIAIQMKFVDELRKQNIDVLLTPAFAFPALDHGVIHQLNPAIIYTFIYNVLDFPAGIVPIQNIESEHNNNQPNDLATKIIRKSLSDKAVLPHSVQVAGGPYEEERTLKAMQIIESIFQYKELVSP